MILQDLITGMKYYTPHYYRGETKIEQIVKKIKSIHSNKLHNLQVFLKNLEITNDLDKKCGDYGIEIGTIIGYKYADNCDDIIESQHVEGYWTDSLLSSIDTTYKEMLNFAKKLSKFTKKNEIQSRIALTYLAIKNLETQYGDKEDEWRLIVKKGKKYIEQFGTNFTEIKTVDMQKQ